VAEALVEQGVGTLRLSDPHLSERTPNLNTRSGLQARSTESPSSVLARRLSRAGHSTDIRLVMLKDTAAGSLQEAISGADFVVVALERPDLHVCHLVNRQALITEVPWLLAGLDGHHGFVGPLFVPGYTSCYNCYQTLAWGATPSPTMSQRYRRHLLERRAPADFAGLPGFAQIVAGYTSLAVVDYLLRRTSFIVSRVVTLGFDRMTVDVEDVLKLPRCPVCDGARPPAPPVFSGEVVTRHDALALRQASPADISPQ
jgi:bacteriocin biosynthesis cyclodehydratase domain-containing protein